MSYIKNYIEEKNRSGKKVLSVFITAGYPKKENFIDLAKAVIDSGADIIELGIPFSDPLADGPVIQKSSQTAIENGVTLRSVLNYCEQIKSYSEIPIVLMGYANPILHYGYNSFIKDAISSGASGLIVPDIPIEEYDNFFLEKSNNLDIILLTTPTSPNNRIIKIDEMSQGFVYCVSVTGITGAQRNQNSINVEKIQTTRELIKKNKMLVGFGISDEADVISYIPFCDGVIVGSAVIKALDDQPNFDKAIDLIKRLNKACYV